MTKYQFGFIVTLLITSVVFLLVPFIVYLFRKLVAKSACEPRSKFGVSRMLIFSACLIGSVWCLRYAVGYFGILFPNLSTIAPDASSFEGLTWWEEILNSMVHALQTFSMDEDYTAYIISGKTMLREMFGVESSWQTVYGIYATVLNFVAPIAGGAVIFEILASIFPKIRLFVSYFAFWKEKYYFSELNNASLALAKSIVLTSSDSCLVKRIIKAIKRPIIIFTDAYIDDEEEKDSEMLLEAKILGAISVRDDLSHVKKNRFGARKFFLIDEKESGNLQTLTALANSNNNKYIKNAEIYLFTNDDAYVQVEKNILNKLKDDWGLQNKKDEELPLMIFPIQSYRNLISNLLAEQLPLYEPLIGKKKNNDGTQDLTVTIMGTGHIGTEMFLSTYWFGQMLNCNLKINILSDETEEKFWNKIDYVNPEIRHTTIKNDPILRINNKGDMAPIYCSVNYRQCDVKSSKFLNYLTDGEENVLETDYYFIALGSDENNISVANTVNKYVGQHHITVASKQTGDADKSNAPGKVVIAYVVYDSELSDVLNQKKQYSYDKGGVVDRYMCAVGCLRDVYSAQNVFMTKYKASAQSVHDAYIAMQNREGRVEAYKKRIGDDYKYWATLAQSMHIRYKLFSAGVIRISKLDTDNDDYKNAVVKAENDYKELVSGQKDLTDEQITLLHKLAWLEHRRWNAFTRVKGFRHTDKYNVYAVKGDFKSYKHMDLKLHPCLVECDQKGVRATMNARGVIEEETLLKHNNKSDFDLLDELSYDLFENEYNNYDFKQYDYPISDFQL